MFHELQLPSFEHRTYVITYVSLGFWVFCAECITSLAALRSDTCATPHAFRRAAPPLTGCIRKSSILLILNSNRVWLKTGYNIYITWYNGIPGYTCYFVGKMMMDHGMLGCPVTVYVQKDSCLWASRLRNQSHTSKSEINDGQWILKTSPLNR